MTSTANANSAPVWIHGPDGELGIGAVDWAQLRHLMLVMWLPAFVLMCAWFGWATFVIFCGAIPVSVRLARLHGTPAMIDGAVAHWKRQFTIGSGALLALDLVWHGASGGLTMTAYALGGLAFIYATAIHHNSKRLLAWEPLPDKAAPLPDISLPELGGTRAELEAARVSLVSLPVFDETKPELLDAWEKRDPPRIATLLQDGNRQTQESWSRANAIFNRGQTCIDRARAKLNTLLMQAETRLKPFNLDYDAITIERSKLGYLEMSAAISTNLTAKRINMQTSAFIQAGGRAVMESAFGKLPPWQALAVVASAFVAHFVFKSRMLRRLKDAQGQLAVNAKAVRGDCTNVDTLLATRLLPQLDGMIDVMSRLESGLADLQSEVVDDRKNDQRDKALQTAFALVEGRKLVAMTGGS